MTDRIETLAEGVTLYCGDCREILPSLCVSGSCCSPTACGGFGYCRDINVTGCLLASDPPYGNCSLDGGKIAKLKRNYDPNVRAHIWPDLKGNDEPFDPTSLLICDRLILWGANNYASRLPDSSCWLSWDRKMGRASDSNIGEAELAYVRGLPYKTIRMFRHMWAGFQRDSEVGEVHVHP